MLFLRKVCIGPTTFNRIIYPVLFKTSSLAIHVLTSHDAAGRTVTESINGHDDTVPCPADTISCRPPPPYNIIVNVRNNMLRLIYLLFMYFSQICSAISCRYIKYQYYYYYQIRFCMIIDTGYRGFTWGIVFLHNDMLLKYHSPTILPLVSNGDHAIADVDVCT